MADGRERQVGGHQRLAGCRQFPQKIDADAGRFLGVVLKTVVPFGLLEPDLSPKLLLISVAIAILVGVVSGLYPAWRSSRLSPTLAIHG